MRIQVLGCGGAFSPEIGNSSIILWDGKGKGFLIDCGYTVYPLLKKKNLIDKIDRVFITHRHGDHIGSLDTFLYHKRFMFNQKVTFYGLSDHLPYLKTIDPGFENDAEAYFKLGDEGIKTMSVKHCDGMACEAFYNFGLLYSGDTAESLLETPQARDAKIILHEVTFNESVSVHAPFNVLARAAVEVKKKTWLYHYNVGEDKEFESKVRQHGFAGLLTQDQMLKF